MRDQTATQDPGEAALAALEVEGNTAGIKSNLPSEERRYRHRRQWQGLTTFVPKPSGFMQLWAFTGYFPPVDLERCQVASNKVGGLALGRFSLPTGEKGGSVDPSSDVQNAQTLVAVVILEGQP